MTDIRAYKTNIVERTPLKQDLTFKSKNQGYSKNVMKKVQSVKRMIRLKDFETKKPHDFRSFNFCSNKKVTNQYRNSKKVFTNELSSEEILDHGKSKSKPNQNNNVLFPISNEQLNCSDLQEDTANTSCPSISNFSSVNSKLPIPEKVTEMSLKNRDKFYSKPSYTRKFPNQLNIKNEENCLPTATSHSRNLIEGNTKLNFQKFNSRPKNHSFYLNLKEEEDVQQNDRTRDTSHNSSRYKYQHKEPTPQIPSNAFQMRKRTKNEYSMEKVLSKKMSVRKIRLADYHQN